MKINLPVVHPVKLYSNTGKEYGRNSENYSEEGRCSTTNWFVSLLVKFDVVDVVTCRGSWVCNHAGDVGLTLGRLRVRLFTDRGYLGALVITVFCLNLFTGDAVFRNNVLRLVWKRNSIVVTECVVVV